MMGIFGLLLRALFPRRKRQSRRSIEIVAKDHRPTSPWASPARARPDPYRPAACIVDGQLAGRSYIVDGDTLVIDRIAIRLYGIDAPELDHPYGKNAKWALINLCRGQVVTAIFDGSSSYERLVATCFLPDGRDLSAEMVKLGLALDWRRYSGGKYRGMEPPEARKLLWRADARQKGLIVLPPEA